MAGSGGGYNPKKVRSEVRELQSKIDSAKYEAEVAHLLSSVLASANNRDTELVKAHLVAIKQAIEKEVEGFVDLLFGGSVAKRTYVEGISDVDALVVLNVTDQRHRDPRARRRARPLRARRRRPSSTAVSPECA